AARSAAGLVGGVARARDGDASDAGARSPRGPASLVAALVAGVPRAAHGDAGDARPGAAPGAVRVARGAHRQDGRRGGARRLDVHKAHGISGDQREGRGEKERAEERDAAEERQDGISRGRDARRAPNASPARREGSTLALQLLFDPDELVELRDALAAHGARLDAEAPERRADVRDGVVGGLAAAVRDDGLVAVVVRKLD